LLLQWLYLFFLSGLRSTPSPYLSIGRTYNVGTSLLQIN
jgi:hypothetical protein